MAFCPKCGVEFDDTMRKAIKKNIRGDEPKQFESYRNKTFQGERVGVYDLDMDEEWGKLSNSDINIDFNKVKVWFGRAVLTFIAIISIACVSKAFVCANCGEIHLTRYRYENFSDEKE